MAIDRIPGVGPTNADIATAVAAPSAASIAAAVAAPSAATIASAVAAPSAASIASAVAAPSSATITSAVLSAGNSAGWGNAGETWTLLSNASTPAGGNTLTFSSLSGYKKYRIVFGRVVLSGNAALLFRMNGLTTGYNFGNLWQSSTTWGNANSGDQGLIQITQQGSIGFTGIIDIEQANLGGIKNLTATVHGANASGTQYYWETIGNNTNTGAISSFNFYTNGLFSSPATVSLYGGN